MDKTVIDAKHMTRTFDFEERVDVERLVQVGHDTTIGMMSSMTRTERGVGHGMALASLTLKLASFEL